MLKSFFYHCRTIKANGWIVAIIPLALLAIGLFIGSKYSGIYTFYAVSDFGFG